MDLTQLSANLLTRDQQLVHTKYFTSRISSPKGKRERQSTYIEALETLDNLSIHYGHYLRSPRECRSCGSVVDVPSEKMTDVNIAVELLTDAFQNNFDTALLISADSDLTAPIVSVRRLFPQKNVVIGFPPERSSEALKKVATRWFPIWRVVFAKSQLPPKVARKSDGFILERPSSWR